MALNSTREMVEQIKDLISKPYGEVKIFDKDVASVLELSPINLATKIKRDTPPFKEIVLWCDKCGYPPMKIFIEHS